MGGQDDWLAGRIVEMFCRVFESLLGRSGRFWVPQATDVAPIWFAHFGHIVDTSFENRRFLRFARLLLSLLFESGYVSGGQE